MTSLVLELQRDALDSRLKASDLLRKALIVARKLRVTEFENWISNELNGYSQAGEIPAYRLMHGEVKAWNPRHGFVPVMFDDPKVAEQMSRRFTGQSMGEIEALVQTITKDSGFNMPFSKDMELSLMRSMRSLAPPTLHIPHAQLARILDAVRNAVLNWALKLEEDGIVGNELAFTVTEKEIAARNTYTVNNFFGPVINAGNDVYTGGDVIGRDKGA